MKKNGIILRPMTLEDTEDIVRWRNSESVKKFFIYQDEFTRDSHENWIKTKVETGDVVQFMIVEEGSQKAVGSVYLRDIDRENRKAEYGIFIGEDEARGKGYGALATRKMLEYAFGEMGLHRVYLRAFADNIRAISTYKKEGFKVEGILTDDVFVNGQFRDIAWMAKINTTE